MKVDTLTIRSSIKQELYSKILKRGTFLGAIGMLPILYGAIFMGPAKFSTWGFPLFILGMGLIAIGMIPIRRLTHLQQHANLLILTGTDFLEYHYSGKKTLTVPVGSIESITFLDDEIIYGIGIKLKKTLNEKVIINDPRFSYERYRKESLKRYECDLYFPYFTQRGFQKIKHLSALNHAS